jgi:hypothetical protein
MEIEIFLSVDETQMSFLSISRSDIERLAVSPFQWIRYVMFAICGVVERLPRKWRPFYNTQRSRCGAAA